MALTIIQENSNAIFKNENKINNFGDFILKLYSSVLENNYYPNLGKCDLLSMCSFCRNPHFNYIFDDINKRKLFLKLLIKFALNHKDENIKTKSKIINDKVKCDFINNSDDDSSEGNEFFDLDETEDEFDYIFYEKFQKCLLTHSTFNNSDEFKIFSETFFIIKNNDQVLFNDLIDSYGELQKKVVNNLIHVRNINIEYNGKKIQVPRITLKIKRNVC